MADAHKDSGNKILPPVCGCLFEKLLHKRVLKNVLKAHVSSKTTRNVKTVTQLLRMLLSAEELHHDHSSHADSS